MPGRRTLFLLALFLAALPAWAQGDAALRRQYKPGLRRGTVAAFLKDLRRQTGLRISYASSVVDSTRRVHVPARVADVGALLEDILRGQAVEPLESDGGVLLVPRSTSATAGRYRIITGRLREAGSGEVLIGAAVYDPDLQAGTMTNAYGLYQLALPEGERRLCLSYVGYQPDTFRLPATGNLRRDMDLKSLAVIAEVSVAAKDRGTPGERIRLTPADLKTQAQTLGEADPMRGLQVLPGVQSGVDGGSGIIVRGGDPGQNLHLLDGVPLYYVDHFFGLTSVYNADALKAVDFYKGAFPARFGGRVSSVVDVHGRDGSLQQFGGGATIGLVKASAYVEGPIVKDKASFLVSARRSWIDGLLSALPAVEGVPGVYFYDVNAKAHWVVNKNNRLYAGFYTGRDYLRFVDGQADGYYQRVRWNNTVGSLRWNAILSPKLLLDATATYSYFLFDQKDRTQFFDSTGEASYGYSVGASSIRDAALNLQLQWTPGRGHRVQLGARAANADFTPTTLERITGEGSIINPVTSAVSSQFQNTELTLYAEDAIRLGERWILRPGIHATEWLSGNFWYGSLQPRLYTSYRPAPGHSIYASFSRMGQFLHLLSNNGAGLSNDFWVPSTARIRPEQSWLGTLGWSGLWRKLSFSIEGYYKDVDGVIAYNTGRSLFDNSDRWQDKIEQGRGWSYGAEFSARRDFGAWNASMAYTLSWNWRRFGNLNGGEKFPYRYDRRHNLNLKLCYAPSRRFDALMQWMYLSGEAFTLPDQLYPDLDNNLHLLGASGFQAFNGSSYTYNYSAWNAYRLPSIHRLDAGVNFTRYRGARYVRTWSLGMFNMYGRPNVNWVVLEETDGGALKLQGVSLLRFIPYVSLKVKF